MFVIFPTIMLAVFLVFYISSENRLHLKERQEAEAKAKADAIEAQRKAEAEENARVAAQRRRTEQKAEDARKEAERLAKYQAQLNGVLATEKKYEDEANARAQQASDLQVKLDSLHHERDLLNQHDFQVLKELETARIKERNAELNIQRMVTRIEERAENSTMVQMPPLPPTER
jgi:flagellar motor protein MotB